MLNLLVALSCAALQDPAPTVQWGGARSGVESPRVELIEDAGALAEAWQLTHGGSSDGQPQINFERCRLVLALNGADTDVFSVWAMELGQSQEELTLGLDARGSQREGDGPPERTTAWGLFLVPRAPSLIRVRENVSRSLTGDPVWKPIATLGDPEPAGPASGQELRPDLSLLQPRRADDRDEDVEGTPHVAMFDKDGKQLLFIAARHGQDIEGSPTHAFVREAMRRFRPQVAIIEGVSTSKGPQPERFMKSARRRVASGNAPEAMYTAVLADDLGAVVIGGEPDDEVTPQVIREAGYSDEDLLGFLLARRLVSMLRNDRIDDEFLELADRSLRQLKARHRIESDFDAQDFLEWYETHLGAPFNPRRVKQEVSPSAVDEPTILRKMAILVMKAREHNLAELEARMLREHDRVLVVYGSGHLRWERAMLEQMLGPPEFVTSRLPGDEDDGDHGDGGDRGRPQQPWTKKVDDPPRYFVSAGYAEQWPSNLREGIDAAREYLGDYGPTHVFIIGQEDEELADPTDQDAVARAFCEVHNEGSERPLADCRERDGRDLVRKALAGDTEAYLTMAMESDPPAAELVFINSHEFGAVDMHTRGIHEYTHVYQMAFPFTPTWMTEGGAELLACHLGEQRGWGDRSQTMRRYARHLEQAEDLEYTIRDMEEVESAPPDVARWHRQLAYDAGAWAVAYMVHRSKSRSIGEYFRTFYPMVERSSWQEALCEYTGLPELEAFYQGFDEFLAAPMDHRLSVLESLED
jgi:hypothetical protein